MAANSEVNLSALHMDILFNLDFGGAQDMSNLFQGVWLDQHFGRSQSVSARDVREACYELERLGMISVDQQSGVWSVTALGRAVRKPEAPAKPS